MSLTHRSKAARPTLVTNDSVYNLLTQDPESVSHVKGGLALNGDVQVGQEFTLLGRCVTAAALKAVVTYTCNLFSKNAPFKFRVLEIQAQLVSYTQTDWTDADGGNLDVTVQDGDGAASESFTDVLADQAWDDTYTDGMALRYPSSSIAIANTEIDEGESLRAQVVADPDDTIVAGAGAGPCTIDFVIRCLRVE